MGIKEDLNESLKQSINEIKDEFGESLGLNKLRMCAIAKTRRLLEEDLAHCIDVDFKEGIQLATTKLVLFNSIYRQEP
jgi:hypothetical protein